MNIQYFHDFLAAAKYLNYSIAADELFISPAVMSKHILSLENALGVKLFSRTTRTITLTKYGELLVPHAKRIIEEEEAFLKRISALESEKTQAIRILTIPVYLHYGIADRISDFGTLHPHINLSIKEIQPQYQMDEFEHGNYDIAIFGFPPTRLNDKLHCEPIEGSHIVATMSSAHPLSSKATLSLEDFKNEDILIDGEATGLFQLLQEAFKTAGFSPRVKYKAENPETLLRYVCRDNSVALMAKKVVEYYNIPNITCIDIYPLIKLNLYLVWFKKQQRKNVSAFLNAFL